MKCLIQSLFFLLIADITYGQGLTFDPPGKFTKPSTPDSLYKEGKSHVQAGVVLCVLGPAVLATGSTLLAMSVPTNYEGRERPTHAALAFGGILTLVGAVSTVMGPIALATGEKEIKLGRERLALKAYIRLPMPMVSYPTSGNSGTGLGLSTVIRF